MEGIGFIETLKELMDDNGLNVNQFAERVGCDKAAVRRWLYDMYLPDPETLIKIADVFGVSADYLFGFSDSKEYERNIQSTTFYERYDFLKKLHNCTDYSVSKNCAIRDSAISKWKTVKKFPTTASLIKLAKYFQCNLDFLLGRCEYKN